MAQKIYKYDIWDGPKGIVFASSDEEAICKVKTAYPDILVCDHDNCDPTESGNCCLDYVCGLDAIDNASVFSVIEF